LATFDSVEPVPGVDAQAVAEAVRGVRSAWNDKDYPRAVSESRLLLEREPGNLQGLIYLARAAAYTGDWADVIFAGEALIRQSPREAFTAARKLNHVGQVREAAEIFAALEMREDWFGSEVADMAWAEAVSLLKAGQVAADNGDSDLAKILWVAGARIAPRSQILMARVRQLATQAKTTASEVDRDTDPSAYISAWREVLWLDPSNLLAAIRLAWAYERLDAGDAIDAWLKVLAIERGNAKATERLRRVAMRNDLEDRAVRGLVELDGPEDLEPLIHELAESRDAKAREARESALKAKRREALARANAADRAAEPQGYLAAWKEVLALDSTHVGAARKVVSVAHALGDHAEQVEGLIALLEVTPDETVLRDRLVSAAQRAGKERRALEYLSRHGGLESLPVEKVEGLRKRVINACKRAVSVADFNLALANFRALALASDGRGSIEPLRLSLAKKAISSAREAERQGDLAVAVPLAEQVLEIDPDHPVALSILARDLLRQRRFGDVIELCQPRMKPGEEYEAVRKLVERATAKLPA
jgi:tetratricopeptide (TPR) repeat protein